MSEQKNTDIKDMIYCDPREQTRRVNRFILIGTSVIMSYSFIFVILQILKGEIGALIGIIGFLLLATTLVVGQIAYRRDPYDINFKAKLLGCYFVAYLYCTILIPNDFMIFIATSMLMGCMLYNDRKFTTIGSIIVVIGLIIGQVYQLICGGSLDFKTIAYVVSICLLHITMNINVKIADEFNTDMFGVMNLEKEKKEETVQQIIQGGLTVRGVVKDSEELMDELNTANENMNNSLNEIRKSTEVTVDSIKTQAEMTQAIDRAINQTLETAEQTTKLGEDSRVYINENMEAMGELEVQARDIALTNTEVITAMEQLQGRIKEVEAITEIILNISNQTNLLALNASIESVRAGEAGKGFVVVAEQIRQLSEQTKQSTEGIKQIVDGLQVNSLEVSAAIEKSILTSTKQGEKINAAVDNFTTLQNNMQELIEKVESFNGHVNQLSNSNKEIINRIEQVSTSSAEILGAAKATEQLGEDNMEKLKDIRVLLRSINHSDSEMDEYFIGD